MKIALNKTKTIIHAETLFFTKTHNDTAVYFYILDKSGLHYNI